MAEVIPAKVANPMQPVFAHVSDIDFKQPIGKRATYKAPSKIMVAGQVLTCTIPAFAVSQPLVVRIPDPTKDPILVALTARWYSLACPHCTSELEIEIGKAMGKVHDEGEASVVQ